MKRTFAFATIVAAVCLLAGCQKEGKYNPKEKIAKIYTERSYSNSYYDGTRWIVENEESSGKQLSESWTWDGKKLSQIAYYDDGEAYINVKLTYDGSQLIEATDGETRMVYTYDGKKIEKCEVYEGSVLFETMTFGHDGKKISSVTYTYTNAYVKSLDKGVTTLSRLMMRSLVPDSPVADRVIKDVRAHAAKEDNTYTLNFTWDGGNVTKITATSGAYSTTMTCTYDDKNNPYQGFALALSGLYGESESGVEFCNENNILSVTATYTGEGYTESETETYSYEYDGNWPVKQTRKYNWESDEYRSSNKRITYLEYE